MCFMTFVSLSSCRLCCCCRDETTSGQKQRTADFMLFADIISDFLYRMQTRVQWSARVQSTRADTVKIQPFDVICCHITTKHCSTGRGECVCRLQCPLLQHCMQQAVSPPALPPPPQGAAVLAAGENRNIFTPNFLDGTDWRTQPRVEKRSTDTIVMMKGIFFYFYFDHLALKKVYSLLINIPRQQNFIMALKRLDYECDILP